MGLPGQHIVETGLARLAAFWPSARHQARLPDFMPVTMPTDASAVAIASAIYNGSHPLDDSAFSDLRWLSAFARSGRQILMCHALRLLDGWNASRRASQSVAAEAAILDVMAAAAGPFAAALDGSLLQPLQNAFLAQLHRLQALRCHTAQERLTKALSLLAAARVTRNPSAVAREAMPLLDKALAHLVASDGGPTAHPLPDYARWMTTLLQASDLPHSSVTRNALDRARPFLAMTLGADKAYCFDRSVDADASVLETAPLRLAAMSKVARIDAGKAVAIALPGQLAEAASLNLSSHGLTLLQARLFTHDQAEDQSVTALAHHASPQGHLLQQDCAVAKRMVFISPKGDDIRIEETLPNDALPRWMPLTFNPDAKVSVARAGNHVTIALSHRNLWQLSLRGGVILPQQTENELVIAAKANRVCWALKRIARSTAKSEKPAPPELPF